MKRMYVLFRYYSIWWFSFFYFIFYSFNIFFCEKVEISYGRYETQVTSESTVEETGYESPQTSKMKTTVLQTSLEAPWPCTCNPLLFVHKLWLNKLMRCFFWVFSHDVTAAILVFQNNETAAMLVYQTSTVGVELFSYVKNLFCSNRLA